MLVTTLIVSLLLLIRLSRGQTIPSRPRRPIVNTITCSGSQSDLPPGIYGPTAGRYIPGKGLPAQPPIWSASNFTSAVDLCSATGNLAANIGGVCVEDPDTRIRHIEFCVTLAWLTHLFSNELGYYCARVCRCNQDEDAHLEQSLMRARIACSLGAMLPGDIFRVDGPPPPPPPPPDVVYPPDWDGRQLRRPRPSNLSPSPLQLGDWGVGAGRGRGVLVSNNRVAGERCGTSCTANRQCDGTRRGRGNGSRRCVCAVREVRRGHWATMGCRASAARQWDVFRPRGWKERRRRGEMLGSGETVEWDWMACACNATYVSLRCCGAEDGVVWEPEDQSLGVLV